MFIPNRPQHQHSGVTGPMPVVWFGVDAPDGDAGDWALAPQGSHYIQTDLTNQLSKEFVKTKNDGRDDDWTRSGGGAITETVTRADFTDGGSTTGTYALKATIPAGAWVHQTILQNVTGFTGDTSATIQVGDGTDVDRYSTGTPSVFTTVAAADLGVPSGTKIHTAAATVTVTITSAADFTNVAAGQFTIKIFFYV